MNREKKGDPPKTQHSRIYSEGSDMKNRFTVLDNPDDRISRQTGDGTTLVENDNPDDLEDTKV